MKDPAKMTKDEALTVLSSWMGVPVKWLDTLISFESRWDPKAKNPYSGARGLIQFMPSTAKDLGYSNADELVNKNPTIGQQLLGPVMAYFKLPASKGPWPTEQSLFMAVFVPTYRKVSPDTMLTPLQRKQNPGIDTVQDYMDLAHGIRSTKKKSSSLGLLLLCGVGIYILYRKYGGA